ncbi:unnamed protein product [Pieris macdunnoughi]|uniref:Uncharacterized protein n=1 Tax=Pieris macdunnoughi TaxID=345717 RepID=A0A821U9H9_9NEOP|nr:unnamed protein product [Pieris macdunnoughi]
MKVDDAGTVGQGLHSKPLRWAFGVRQDIEPKGPGLSDIDLKFTGCGSQLLESKTREKAYNSFQKSLGSKSGEYGGCGSKSPIYGSFIDLMKWFFCHFPSNNGERDVHSAMSPSPSNGITQ